MLGLMSWPERAWLHRQCVVRSAGELRGRAGRDPALLRVRWSGAFAVAGLARCPGSYGWSRGRLSAV